MKNPSRPAIFSINSHTSKLSKYVYHFLEPLAKEVKSYTCDITGLLNKINDIKTIPEDAILVTMDIRSLNFKILKFTDLTSIVTTQNERHLALVKHPNKNFPIEVITTIMQNRLRFNNFNGRHFIEIKGCAMGVVEAPSYASIYMDKFENTYIYP